VHVNDYEIKMETVDGTDEPSQIVEFTSPVDNQKYQIRVKKEFLNFLNNPNKKFKIWVNRKRPEKSLIVRDFDSQSILSLMTKLVFVILMVILIVLTK